MKQLIRRAAREYAAPLALAALLATSVGTVHAQQAVNCAELRSQLAQLAPRTIVNRLVINRCLGGNADEDPSTRRVQQLIDTAARVEGQPRTIKEVVLSVEERQALTLAVLRVADEYLGAVAASAGAETAADATRLRDAVRRALRDREQRIEPGPESPEQRPQYWEWDGESSTLGSTGVDIRALLQRAGCDEAPRAVTCAPAQATAEGLVRGARHAERAFSFEQAAAIQAAAARADVRDARWRSYFADARSQYPWELLVNSWIYERKVRNVQGISGPPSSQWIVLHPDIGMQYIRSADAGDRFKPALILELIGYNRWQWGDDNKPRNGWGASVVRTYADTASVSTGAWGIAIHRNNKYTLTLTRHGDKTGVLLSIDLAGAVTTASQQWRDAFRIGQ